jgi:hypothetical protein
MPNRVKPKLVASVVSRPQGLEGLLRASAPGATDPEIELAKRLIEKAASAYRHTYTTRDKGRLTRASVSVARSELEALSQAAQTLERSLQDLSLRALAAFCKASKRPRGAAMKEVHAITSSAAKACEAE